MRVLEPDALAGVEGDVNVLPLVRGVVRGVPPLFLSGVLLLVVVLLVLLLLLLLLLEVEVDELSPVDDGPFLAALFAAVTRRTSFFQAQCVESKVTPESSFFTAEAIRS